MSRVDSEGGSEREDEEGRGGKEEGEGKRKVRGRAVSVLPGWHGVAEATPKKPRATPQATPNKNMNFGT